MPELIDRWVTEGLITREQAERMHADLAAGETAATAAPPSRQPPPRIGMPVAPEHTSLVVEALGYVGGVIVLVAAGLLAAQYWRTLSDFAQLGVVGAAAVLLLLAGAAVPKQLGAASTRLRSVLWLLATATTAAFAALFADHVVGLGGEDITVFVGAGTAAVAGVLWWQLRILPQQAAFFLALMMTAAAAVARVTDVSHLPGLAVWTLGVAWFVLGWRGRLTPRRPVFALSAASMLVGAVMTLPTDAGMVLALVTVFALVTAAVVFRDLLLLAVGALGALNIVPSVITEWFPGELAPPLALLGFGGLLVAAAVYTAKRGKP